MHISELKSAYDNKTLAAKQEEPDDIWGAAPGSITRWGVEPGDATHYTVETRANGAVGIAYAGLFMEAEQERNRIAVVADCQVLAHPVCSNEYQKEILIYLAMLATGNDWPEPEGLSWRRSACRREERQPDGLLP